MSRIASLAMCTLFLFNTVAAAPLVSGNVSTGNGIPLPDVRVQLEVRGVVRTAAYTDLRGGFQFDAAALSPAVELRDISGFMLLFSKPGFEPANKLVRINTTIGSVILKLDPSRGSATLPSAEKRKLDQYTAAPGSAPVFLIPYSITGVALTEPKKVNEMLRANLERVIVTHLQASQAGGSTSVSLKLLPVEPLSDIDRMRTYGSYLDALGIITGYGTVESAASGMLRVGFSSTFLVVPQTDDFRSPVLYVDDDVPLDSVTSPRLYKHLSKLWGRSTVLALGVREFGKAKASSDREAFTRIRKYLQAERSGAGPGDEALVSQLSALIVAVDRELAR